MILFATAYDEPTVSNLSVARLLKGGRVTLFEGEATRSSLWRVLADDPHRALLAMSHGQRRLLRAQGGEAPHAIQLEDATALGGTRKVFAWACQTSAELGRAAAGAGVVWLGFPVKIAAAPEDARLQALLAEVLQVVVDGLPKVTDATSCKALLDGVVEAARRALEMVDTIEHDSSDQQCFEQFQLRFEAWLPGCEEPIRPTAAPTISANAFMAVVTAHRAVPPIGRHRRCSRRRASPSSASCRGVRARRGIRSDRTDASRHSRCAAHLRYPNGQ